MIIYINGTCICPSCGSPHPLRFADSCGYCEDCPEIRGEMLQLPQYAKSRAKQGEFDRLLPDGRKLSLMPYLFGAGHLGISEKPPFHNLGIFADSWDFLNFFHALIQFHVWDGEGEPDGWSRHPGTGRYRIDGDGQLEYIKDDNGTIEARIERAIHATQGMDHVVLKTEEEQCSQGDLPDGTRLFLVESEHFIGDNKCFHVSQCYIYYDRVVVLSLNDLMHGALATVVRRLTGENANVPRNHPA